MSLRIRRIQLRVQTTGGLYGTDVAFNGGLTVLYAPNTSGKSTTLQALLYALGLEQMLSARREIPLPFAMKDYLEDPDTGALYNVLESFVAAELENGSGQIITVRRNVISNSTDKRLVTVSDGPRLSDPTGEYEEKDFFVLDPGAAKRDAGFHRMLAEFMGWSLPTVKRYDGSETSLYIENVFPLFYVEQKLGWSSLPAAIPTQFRIRDVAKRSVEFLLALETHALELRRQDLDLRLNVHRTAWMASVSEIKSLAAAHGLNVQQLASSPTAIENDVRAARLQITIDGKWRSLDGYLSDLHDQLEAYDIVRIPEVEGVAAEAAIEVDRLTLQVQELSRERNDIFRGRQNEVVQRQSTLLRIEQIEDDLKKNKDAQKLKSYGSQHGHELSPGLCPTCEQPVDDALLPQGTIDLLMSLDDNIEFLSAQRTIFKRLVDRSDVVIKELDLDLLSTADDVRQRSARLRALKSDLIAPSHAASASFIEERLRLDARLQKLSSAREHFDTLVTHLVEQSVVYAVLLSDWSDLPKSRFSGDDTAKLALFNQSIQEQLRHYSFKTFSPSELEVSEDTYRPQKEGFEIGFELSASDAIRLKWAYQMGLLYLSTQTHTHHPGFLILDEPRQQEAAEASVSGLLTQAAALGAKGTQIIIATSERLETVQRFISSIDHPTQLIAFDGYVIRRIEQDG